MRPPPPELIAGCRGSAHPFLPPDREGKACPGGKDQEVFVFTIRTITLVAQPGRRAAIPKSQ